MGRAFCFPNPNSVRLGRTGRERRKRPRILRLTRTKLYPKVLLLTFLNGSSEMVSNLSTSIVSLLYNLQLMKLAGEDGVAAFGIIMYASFIFMAVFMGYSIGSAPVASYHFGAGDRGELKNLFWKSLVLMVGAGAVLTLVSELLAVPLGGVFASFDAERFAMTCRGFRLHCLAFLFMRVNVWASAFLPRSTTGAFPPQSRFSVRWSLRLPLSLSCQSCWGSTESGLRSLWRSFWPLP